MQAGSFAGRRAASSERPGPRCTAKPPTALRAIERKGRCGEGRCGEGCEEFPGCRGWAVARKRVARTHRKRLWLCGRLCGPGDRWRCTSGLSVGRSETASVTAPTSLHRIAMGDSVCREISSGFAENWQLGNFIHFRELAQCCVLGASASRSATGALSVLSGYISVGSRLMRSLRDGCGNSIGARMGNALRRIGNSLRN
jgi:hypothetical protein